LTVPAHRPKLAAIETRADPSPHEPRPDDDRTPARPDAPAGSPVSAGPGGTAGSDRRRRSPDGLVQLAADAAVVLAAGWLLVVVLPYAEVAGRSASLHTRTTDPDLRWVAVVPRLLGALVVAAAAWLALVRPRARLGAWCTAAAALTGLSLFAAWWVSSPTIGTHLVGWYLEVALCVLAVPTIALGAVGVRDQLAAAPPPADRRLLRSAPWAAGATGVVAVASTYLMTRDPTFMAAFAYGSGSVAGRGVPTGMRLSGLLLAVAMVVVPLLATLVPDRSTAAGLGLGWSALVAAPAGSVLAADAATGVQPSSRFVIGLVLVAVGSVALAAWSRRAGRPRPLERPA
jgi:hypothetical protein